MALAPISWRPVLAVSLAAAQEPQASVTPDPSRSYAPVEEIQLSGGAQVGNFYVKDSTGSGTDLNAALQEEPSVHLKQDGSVEILIYHTHTSEAYSQSYTGFYYTASMAAQVVTPMFSGFLMDKLGMTVLFPYAAIFVAGAFVTMLFVRHGDSRPIPAKGLEALDVDD